MKRFVFTIESIDALQKQPRSGDKKETLKRKKKENLVVQQVIKFCLL